MRSITEAEGLMVTSEEEGDLFGRETVCDSTLGLTELPAGELLL